MKNSKEEQILIDNPEVRDLIRNQMIAYGGKGISLDDLLD